MPWAFCSDSLALRNDASPVGHNVMRPPYPLCGRLLPPFQGLTGRVWPFSTPWSHVAPGPTGVIWGLCFLPLHLPLCEEALLPPTPLTPPSLLALSPGRAGDNVRVDRAHAAPTEKGRLPSRPRGAVPSSGPIWGPLSLFWGTSLRPSHTSPTVCKKHSDESSGLTALLCDLQQIAEALCASVFSYANWDAKGPTTLYCSEVYLKSLEQRLTLGKHCVYLLLLLLLLLTFLSLCLCCSLYSEFCSFTR